MAWAEAEAKAEAEEKARADAQARAQDEQKARTEAELKAKAEEKFRTEAELRAKAEEKARVEAELRAQAEKQARAEAQARAQAKEKAKTEAQAKAQAEEKARAEAEAKARAEENFRAEAQARAQAEKKARVEARAQAEEKARVEAELRAQAEKQARAEAEKLKVVAVKNVTKGKHASSDSGLLAICAENIMQKDILWGNPDESVQQALIKMRQCDAVYMMIGCDKVPSGIVSKSDLKGVISPYLQPVFAKWRRPLDDATLNIRVKWTMNSHVHTIPPEIPLVAIMGNMRRFGTQALPVVDRQGKVQGLVTVFDIFEALSPNIT